MNRMPREILEKAIQLPDSLKKVYLTLYRIGKPSTATETAKQLNLSRAYTDVRLNQLVMMNLVKTKKKGRVKLYFIEEEEKQSG